MIALPAIDPVALQLGPLAIRWYSLSALVGIAAIWWFGTRHSVPRLRNWTLQDFESIMFASFIGILIGGRIGYMLFYGWPLLLADPLSLFRIWDGGLSFHGGLVGILTALFIWGRLHGKEFFVCTDLAGLWVPVCICTVRLGNFMNGELWGRQTDVPWGMVFAGDPEQVPRHPSQLYESFLEGMVLFLIVHFAARRVGRNGMISGIFLMGYATMRISIEFFRQPDSHIGFDILGWITRGQLLSLPVLLVGAGLLVWARYRGTDRRKVWMQR